MTPRDPRRSRYPYLVAAGLYLALSVVLWAHVWTGHPSAVATCGCGDASATLWFSFWPSYALSHGLDPLFSTAVGYPTGVSLIFAAFGIPLAPLTWLFGAVASLNVAFTVFPVVTALSMFALVRRWVSWMPAAFVAGLFYGFSPFVLNNLTSGHVDLAFLAIPPLAVLCLDELVIRQRRSPLPIGIVLGALLSLQFLAGAEILVLLLLECAMGLVLIVIDVARRDPTSLRAHAHHAVVGGVAAAVTGFVLLAYPVWLVLAGPAHYSGSIHPGLRLGAFGGSLERFFLPPKPLVHGAFSSAFFRIVGGYQGPVLSAQYFGLGVLVVCVAGVLVWRRQRLLWLFGLLTLASMFLTVSSGPWLGSLPSSRTSCRATSSSSPTWPSPSWWASSSTTRGTPSTPLSTRGASGDARSGGRVGSPAGPAPPAAWWWRVVAVAPPAAYVAQNIPFTVEPIVLPTWFRTVAPHLAGHPVVLALPAPFSATKASLKWTDADAATSYPLIFSGKQAAMTWQALSGQRFSIVGSGGLGAGTVRPGAENAGPERHLPGDVRLRCTARRDLRRHRGRDPLPCGAGGWTPWCFPTSRSYPEYDQVASVPDMAALITGATGLPPVHIADAWVWNGVRGVESSVAPTCTRFEPDTATSPGWWGAATDRAGGLHC